MRKMIYFRDTNVVECWTCASTGEWSRSVDRYAFDDLRADEFSYYAFDSKPENWLGDRDKNPCPYIAW